MNTMPKPQWPQQSQSQGQSQAQIQGNPRPAAQTSGLNRPMAWIGVMLLAMLVAVGLARWSGLDPRTPDAAVQWQRDLQFGDVAGGDIVVMDHTTCLLYTSDAADE